MTAAPDPTSAQKQAAYAAFRRAWRAALERWIAAGRPDHLAVWLP